MAIAHHLESFAQDVRFGVRTLLRSRALTLVTLVVLALGIGANTPIFSLVNPFFLRPLEYPQAERLVHLHHTDAQAGHDRVRFSMEQVRDLREQTNLLAGIGAYAYGMRNLTGDGGEPEQVSVGRLSANSMALLGVEPIVGRAFQEGDDEPGAAKVAILGYGLWQRRFGGRQSVVGETLSPSGDQGGETLSPSGDQEGETLRLNGETYDIIGVMDRGFRFPYPEVRMWTPQTMDLAATERSSQWLEVFARMKPGVTRQAALAELETVHQRLAQQHPDVDGLYGVRLVPIRESLLFAYKEIRMVMMLLMVAAGFVLLIVAANVANLTLAKAAARATEVAVRTSLGAGRSRLLRQFLTESTILAVGGGALGVALAHLGTRALASGLPEALFFVGEFGVDRTALVFTLTISLLSAVVFGLVPALKGTSFDLVSSLKDGGRAGGGGAGGDGARSGKLRSALVVSQISFAVFLLCGAAVMLGAAWSMKNVDLGFESDNVVTMNLVLPSAQYEGSAERLAFYDTLTQRLEGLAGVERAASINRLPLNFASEDVVYEIPGRDKSDPKQRLVATRIVASPGYFDALRVPLHQGRTLERGDTADTRRVALVNQVLAERYWRGGNAVGQTIRIEKGDGFETATVVGVVANVRFHAAWMSETIEPQIYLPPAQAGMSSANHLVLRTQGDPLSFVQAVRREIRGLDADLPISSVRAMEQVVVESLGPLDMGSQVLGGFSVAAMLLAMVGIYGVVAYTVSRRRHEIGIRMALGAGRASIVALVVRQGVVLTAVGVAVGLGLAFAATEAVTSAMSGIRADLLAFVAVAVVLGGVSLLASYLPARQVSRIDPMLALRQD